jgi:cell division protein FtsB
MTPRKTQQGASASAGRTSSRRSGAAPSSATRAPGAASPSKPARTSESKPANDGARWWRWLLLPVLVGAAVAICIYVYYPVAKVQYGEAQSKARLEQELHALQARNDRLRTEVARLRTPEGVEDYARVQLGMVKQGENVLIVVNGDKPAPALASTATVVPQLDSDESTIAPAGAWTAFLDSVFGAK